VWITTYYNVAGLMNPWFTIFIDLDTVGTVQYSTVQYHLFAMDVYF